MIYDEPNQSRGYVKTVSSKFGNDQFFDMKSFVEMSRRIQWSKNEFSHRLSPEPTAVGAGCHRATGSAVAVHVASRRWLSFFRWPHCGFMKMRHPLIIVLVALTVLSMSGCATDREAQTWSIRDDAPLLSATNSLPGSTYDIRIYVIQVGDTVAKIAHKFGVSIADLRAINPDLNPTRIKVGQRVNVYEKLIE